MKLIHISDLHIGKKVNGFSLLEEQKDALEQVLQYGKQHAVQGILIAGDVYDKPIPPIEAIELLDWFIGQCHQKKFPVLMIKGNHDSGQRLGFGSGLLKGCGIHIAGGYKGTVPYVDLKDKGQAVRVHLLPFISPSQVNLYEEEKTIETMDEAFRLALEKCQWPSDGVNILVAHQFFAGASQCESEMIGEAGGLGPVGIDCLEKFDYAALGHLHTPQKAGKTGRYSGTLLKYSFSEVNQNKSIVLLEVEDDQVKVELLPIVPLRDMKVLKADYDTVMSKPFRDQQNKEDYFQIILEDDKDIPYAMEKLRTVYPNIMELQYERHLNRSAHLIDQPEMVSMKSSQQLIEEFYEKMNDQPISEFQKIQLKKLMEELHETD